MAVSATLVLNVTAKETLTVDVPAAAGATINHTGFDETINLSGTTTPAITGMAAVTVALSGGTATVDLTNLAGTNGGAVSGNGKKVIAVKFLRGADANNMTIVPGASNGYNMFGASSDLTLYPNSSMLYYLNANAPTIDSTHKTLDFAGTGSQSVNMMVFFG